MRIFLLALMASALHTMAPAQNLSGGLQSGAFESEVTLKLGYKYLLALPEGYEASADKKWPLLVFLHGAGERGNNLEKMKVHGPGKLIAQGKRKFEAVVVTPQVPAGQTWNPHGVKALVDKLTSELRIDDKRIYLTGISMGGFGTWDTIVEYPDVFAAAVPICGGAGIGILKFSRIKTLPIWVFHGEKDPIVPVAFTNSAMQFLRGVKSPAKVTIYPDLQHDSWTRTYADEAMWQWLFAQVKP